MSGLVTIQGWFWLFYVLNSEITSCLSGRCAKLELGVVEDLHTYSGELRSGMTRLGEMRGWNLEGCNQMFRTIECIWNRGRGGY